MLTHHYHYHFNWKIHNCYNYWYCNWYLCTFLL